MSVVGAAMAPETRFEASTVFIVDDDSDVRRAVGVLVRSVNLAAETFRTAAEFLDAYDPFRPGCALLDMRMPGMSGLELQQELMRRYGSPPIIFMSAHGEIASATQALRAGAVDFLTKPYSPQLLLERIHEAIKIDNERLQKLQQRTLIESRLATLTERERQIAERLVLGESTKVIAMRLNISVKTVDNHRAKILEKMGVDNATQLTRLLQGDASV